ncbi:hypothetical protein C8R45DRAFT_931974 [Mycena sanguinolenta]|nr:hypothetical protein C8R45DRAFT_931974 [Mycena sanguinolenta]
MESDSDSGDLPVFDPAEWIGLGKPYREVLKHVSAACQTARELPSSVIRRLPVVNMLVAEFIAVPLPDILPDDGPFSNRPPSWFSGEPPDSDDTLVSIPPLNFVRQLETDISQVWLDGAQSIVHHADPTLRPPLWTPRLFREIITVRAAQQKWVESYNWLPAKERYLLNFVSWSSTHAGAVDGQIYWTRLISDEWLSGGIIDAMMCDLKTRVSELPALESSTLIVPLAFQFYITKFAEQGTQPKHYPPNIVAEVESGKTRVLFLIYYNEDHWMAFMINFANKTFGFGGGWRLHFRENRQVAQQPPEPPGG